MMKFAFGAASAVGLSAASALAQVAPPPAASPAPTVTAPATATPPVAKRSSKPAIRATERCMRLPLSDVAFGKEASIAAARTKLAEYAAAEAKKRRWLDAPLVKSNEVVGGCELYLDFGPLVEKEYRCLVTATFCQK